MATNSLPNQNNSHKPIYWALGTIFFIAAALNYDALRHFALDQVGVNYYLSFLVPILVDILIATAVYITLINQEQGENTGLAWSVVILFTFGSMYLNYLHYPKTVGGISMAIFVPLVVFVASELGKQQMEILARRGSVISTIQQLLEQVKNLEENSVKTEAAHQQSLQDNQAQIAALQTQIDQKQTDLQTLTDAIQQAKSTLKETKELPTKLDEKTIKAYQFDALVAAGMTQTDAADLLGHTPKTLSNYTKKYVNGLGLRE